MTGRLRLGKMSTFMRQKASALPKMMARMPTITVIGCRKANIIGFIVNLPSGEPAAQARDFLALRALFFSPFLLDDPERLIVILDNLGYQFLKLFPRFLEDFFAGGGGPVVFPLPPLDYFGSGLEVAKFFQKMQSRVESPLTETIAVADQFLGDLGAVRRLIGSMIEDVQADETVKEMACNRIVSHDV